MFNYDKNDKIENNWFDFSFIMMIVIFGIY